MHLEERNVRSYINTKLQNLSETKIQMLQIDSEIE